MYSLKVKGKLLFSGHEILIIEGGFGEQDRVLMPKTIAEFHNIRVADVNKLINDNLDKLRENVDLINICDIVINDKKLRDKLELKPTEVCKGNKYIYILSMIGYLKIASVMNSSNDTKFNVIETLIDKYFKANDLKMDETVIKPLPRDEVNEILSLINQNPYIKEYIKILVPPRGNKGKDFKRNEISKFTAKINKDVEKYLISCLEVPDLDHIPTFTDLIARRLIKECYILPEDLKKEFSVLFNKLMETREDVIKDNQLKNENAVRCLKEELEKVKLIIREYLP